VHGTPSSLKIPYLQLQADGLITGKFMLHVQTPTVDSDKTIKASRMIYPATKGLTLADATASFTDVMKTFTNTGSFEMKDVTPDLPTDWKGVPITLPGVPITLTVSIGLVAEMSANRDNQFKASLGAFARAEASVGLFVFSKMDNTCSDSSWVPNSQYTSVCQDVLQAAGITENNIESSQNAFYILLKRTGPTVKTGFSAPSVTAKNNEKVFLGIGFYPM
jgi:hypothetical protein